VVIAEAMHGDSGPEPTADADAPRAVADGGRVESTDGGHDHAAEDQNADESGTGTDSDDELPAIETISGTRTGRPLRGKYRGCGKTGPTGLDGPIILHVPDCPHAQADEDADVEGER
jgi:hypothetical protein